MTDKTTPPLDDVHRVLTELLRLYDWRFELARMEVKGRDTTKLLNQYGREKKAAWEAARRVLAVAPSEIAALTIEDKRWRFLEHGCQWVSWTPIGGETVSFDPRDVKYLRAMRDYADKTLLEHVERLRAEAHELERRVKK